MEIKEYLIVQMSNCTHLTEKVNEYITKGYQPLGNIISNYDNANNSFIQVVVKYKETK